jgi:hypothetical protein
MRDRTAFEVVEGTRRPAACLDRRGPLKRLVAGVLGGEAEQQPERSEIGASARCSGESFPTPPPRPGVSVSDHASGRGPEWNAVAQDRVLLPFERNATERCDQWFLLSPRSMPDLRRFGTARGRLDGGRVLAGHFETVASYLPASVFSSEVTMTRCSRVSRPTSPASR